MFKFSLNNNLNKYYHLYLEKEKLLENIVSVRYLYQHHTKQSFILNKPKKSLLQSQKKNTIVVKKQIKQKGLIAKKYLYLNRGEKLKLKETFFYLNDNKKVVLSLIQENPNNFIYASDKLKNDPDVVWLAVKKNGLLLEHASLEMQNNQLIAKTAVSQNGLALQYVGDNIKNNNDIIDIALQQNPQALEFTSDEYQLSVYNKKKVRMIKNVQQDGMLLRFANEQMRNDPEIVSHAVMQNGLSLQYASYKLKNNKSIVLKAVSQYSGALQYAGPKLKNDFEIKKAAVFNDPRHLNNITPKFHIYYRPSIYFNPWDKNRFLPSLY